MALIIPVVFIGVIVYAAIKKVKIFDGFSSGVNEAVTFTLSLLPCLAAVFMMCSLFEESGLSEKLSSLLAPLLGIFGIPAQLSKLLLIKPFSGSGSLAYLTELIKNYGADSYIARCACVCYGSSETVFYISAIYFAKCKKKRLALPCFAALAGTFLSACLGCLLCRIM